MNNDQEEMTYIDVIGKIKSAVKYLKSKWIIILSVSVIGALLGLAYSILKKPTYTAVCTFVLEDAKSGSNMSQYASLASMAGISMGEGGGGIFQEDNIIELYKSRLMIEKALLSSNNFNGKKQLLINRFINSYNLQKQWKNNVHPADLNFNTNSDNFNRAQDSVVTVLVDLFNEKILNVTKPDKKISIIKVEVVTKDELFSKCFTEKLVQTVNEFYIQTKTKKANQNVRVLQHQADSIKSILNASIYGVASAIDASPNANPDMSTLRTTSQKRQVDVQANSAIYSEIVKNLELAKISLRQDMPLIQVVDKPVLPLKEKKTGKVLGIIIGFASGFALIILLILTRKVIKVL